MTPSIHTINSLFNSFVSVRTITQNSSLGCDHPIYVRMESTQKAFLQFTMERDELTFEVMREHAAKMQEMSKEERLYALWSSADHFLALVDALDRFKA